MADSFIQLSPDSTGKRVDTRTAPDGDHREVNVIGSPTTADVAEADATNGLDVDVTRVIPGTSATHLGKAVDSVPGATDTGVAALVVRDDALAALTPADGDYTHLRTDSTGALWVRDTGGAAGGTAMVDDAVFTPAVTNGTPAFGFADETAPDSVDEGDAGALRMTLDRKLLTRVVGATDSNRLDVDGSGHAQIDIAAASVTVPVSLAAGGTTQYAEDTAHSSGDLVTLAGVVQQTADAALSSDGDRSVLQVDATGFAKVNVKSSALPSGASTLAEQQTQTTHLATIAGDTTSIQTAVEILDNAISGSEMQVDVVAALPAGTNNIGDVDVLSVIPGTGATNLGKAVDSVPGATDTGVTALVVRDDALAALTPADGDYTSLRVNSQGALWTTELNAALIAAAIEIFGSSTYAEGVSRAISIGAVRRDADTTLVDTTNEVAPLQVDANGRLKVEAFSGETLPVNGTVTANQGTAGTAWEMVGDVAADAAVPANPLATGGRASTAVPTAVSADGDAVFQWLNRNGLTLVSGIPGAGLNADPYTLLSETAQYTTTQTSAVLVAGGGSERIVVTSVQIQVGGTTAGTLQVYFGTGAYARGTDEAIFDGEFAPSSTLKPGIFMAPPGGFRAGALGDDILVTTSAAINPLTITVWYYVLGV